MESSDVQEARKAGRERTEMERFENSSFCRLSVSRICAFLRRCAPGDPLFDPLWPLGMLAVPRKLA